MDLLIDTSRVSFQVGRPFEPRLDSDGHQRVDKAGRTNLPLHAVQLIAFDEGGAEAILVTVATNDPPELTQGQFVKLSDLQAIPWVQRGTNTVKVAFRASAVVPVNGAKPSSASARTAD
jgi:hypothetical protein